MDHTPSNNRRKLSWISLALGLIFLFLYLGFTIYEKEKWVHIVNLVYCFIAVLVLIIDRNCGILNEGQSKELAFMYTVTPLGAALIDLVCDLPSWSNYQVSHLAWIAVIIGIVWTLIVAITWYFIDKYKSENQKTTTE